jgi:hypothetical protein
MIPSDMRAVKDAVLGEFRRKSCYDEPHHEGQAAARAYGPSCLRFGTAQHESRANLTHA